MLSLSLRSELAPSGTLRVGINYGNAVPARRDPAVVGSLPRAKLLAQGGRLYGQELSARQMLERLRTFK